VDRGVGPVSLDLPDGCVHTITTDASNVYVSVQFPSSDPLIFRRDLSGGFQVALGEKNGTLAPFIYKLVQ